MFNCYHKNSFWRQIFKKLIKLYIQFSITICWLSWLNSFWLRYVDAQESTSKFNIQHPELLRVSNSPPGANARKYRATTTFSTTRPRRLVDRLVLAWIPRSTEHFSSLFEKRILSFRAIICLRLLSNLMLFDNIPDWWIDSDGLIYPRSTRTSFWSFYLAFFFNSFDGPSFG